jgi:hypothetical protein
MKLIELTGTKQLSIQVFNQILESYKESFPDIYEVLKNEIDIEELVVELCLYAYDKYFSDPEINEINRFYESPIGKKMVRQTPQIYQEVSAMAEERIKKVLSVLDEE